MDREQVLAHRLARHGLDRRRRISLAEAAACPASDFQRDSALLALAARAQSASRDGFAEAIDSGDLVLGFNLRAALHAVASDDVSFYGRTAVSDDDEELGRQLGDGAMKGLKKAKVAPTDALAEVAEATREVLSGGRAVDRVGLHDGPARARTGRAVAVVQGLQEQPRFADAVALRRRRGWDADELRAAVPLGPSGAQAQAR